MTMTPQQQYETVTTIAHNLHRAERALQEAVDLIDKNNMNPRMLDSLKLPLQRVSSHAEMFANAADRLRGTQTGGPELCECGCPVEHVMACGHQEGCRFA